MRSKRRDRIKALPPANARRLNQGVFRASLFDYTSVWVEGHDDVLAGAIPRIQIQRGREMSLSSSKQFLDLVARHAELNLVKLGIGSKRPCE